MMLVLGTLVAVVGGALVVNGGYLSAHIAGNEAEDEQMAGYTPIVTSVHQPVWLQKASLVAIVAAILIPVVVIVTRRLW